MLIVLDDKDLIKRFSFPGGERHVVVDLSKLTQMGYISGVNFRDNENSVLTINARLRTSDDILDLCLLVNSFRHNGVRRLALWLPYVCYQQQDRYSGEGAPFSMKVFADIINSLEFEQVTVYEPHSDVAPALLNNCIVVGFEEQVFQYIQFLSAQYLNLVNDAKIMLVSPDSGAVKRTMRALEYCQLRNKKLIHSEIGFAHKTRNPDTGELQFLGISDNVKNKNLLILDDIALGCGSHLQIAKGLRDRDITVKSLSLFVAHGIFNKNLAELFSYFNEVGTTNSRFQLRADEPLLEKIKVYSC